ncbi:MAG: ModD protein [Desulfobulbus sp.]
MIFFSEHDIDKLIEDDVPLGDMTSLMLGLGRQQGSITLRSRTPIMVCCSEEVERIYTKAGLQVHSVTPSGTFIKEGEPIISAKGSAEAIHLVWRTGSALLECASGIATRTHNLLKMSRAHNPNITLAGTRKHPPYLKKVALKALLAGGAVPHRTGLSDTILLFKEHLLFMGGYASLAANVSKIRSSQKERKIVVEVHTADDAELAVKAGVDCLQFDKLDIKEFKDISAKCRVMNPAICIIAAGGINDKNAEAYSEAGADVLVSSWMYFSPPADIKADIRMVE